jgi:hypothetical protein
MDTLVLKLIVTPVLILAASLAGRRWGETVSGWFVGLPLTSGPVCFFLALERGPGFAAAAARGCLTGAAAEVGFCLAYMISATTTAPRRGWPAALLAGSVGFGAGAAALQWSAPPLWLLAAIVYPALALGLFLMPRPCAGGGGIPLPPRWDIPARIAVATALVLGLTELAPLFGARLSGLLATYPLFAAVLAAFAHRQSGAPAAERVLRGLLVGLFGFAAFFVLLALSIERIGIAASFAAATAAALLIQGGSLWIMRRPRFLRR